MKHIATEEKHTLVLNENEWHVLRCILDCYNGSFAGLEYDDEDWQQTATQLFKLFDIEYLLDKHNDDEW